MNRVPIKTGKLRKSNTKLDNGRAVIRSEIDYGCPPINVIGGQTVEEAAKQFVRGAKLYCEAWRKLGVCKVEEVGRNE